MANIYQLYRKGLDNIGNTCYLNTAIQCLFTDLTIFALQNAKIKQQKDISDKKYNFTRWLYNFDFSNEMIHDLFNNTNYGKFNCYFKIGQQADSFDCLQKLLELVSEESNDVSELINYSYTTFYRCPGNDKCGFTKKMNFGKPVESNAVYTTKNKFIECMRIDPNDKNPAALIGKNMINQIFNHIDKTDIPCEHHLNHKITKYMNEEITTRTIPKLLIIRFTDTTVPCPTLLFPKLDMGTFRFIPVSVAYHTSGMPGNGHYWATVLRMDEPSGPDMYFYTINDRQVTKTEWPNLTTGTQYVIYHGSKII